MRHPAAPHSLLPTPRSAQGAKQVLMDPGAGAAGALVAPGLPHLVDSSCPWSSKAKGRRMPQVWLLYNASQYIYCLCCPLDVSDRQHTPAPHSHPHPITTGPDSSLLPLPWLHGLCDMELTFHGGTKGDGPPNQAEMEICNLIFCKGQSPVFLWLPIVGNTVSRYALAGPGHPDHRANTGVLSQSRYALLRGERRRIAAAP